ncbi:MAG: type II toxin-antitoxin system YafQ family toxin [Coriobacteriales bacterium]|jgi:mRNA interferase YafQ|nr:type II toxin-antitoxin system YafQ family toxin [Coriobacteriales bacterium]
MKTIQRSAKFKRDLKKLLKKHYDPDELKTVLELLVNGEPLPNRYHDHDLKGNWADCRELHVTNKPDWLLLYQIDEANLYLLRTGSHDELFIQ